MSFRFSNMIPNFWTGQESDEDDCQEEKKPADRKKPSKKSKSKYKMKLVSRRGRSGCEDKGTASDCPATPEKDQTPPEETTDDDDHDCTDPKRPTDEVDQPAAGRNRHERRVEKEKMEQYESALPPVKKENDHQLQYLMRKTNGVYKTSPSEHGEGGTRSSDKTRLTQVKRGSRSSSELYKYLLNKYSIRLACDFCICVSEEDASSYYKVSVKPGNHDCLENKLLLRKTTEKNNAWIIIRPCPRRFRPESKLCESFLAGEVCIDKASCPYPHSDEELELWPKYLKSRISLQNFIEDLRESSLMVSLEAERMCDDLAIQFIFVCNSCLKGSNGSARHLKKTHSPVCDNRETPHTWIENKKMVVIRRDKNEMITGFGDCEEHDDADETAQEIHLKVRSLLEVGIKPAELVEESKRFWEKRGRQNPNKIARVKSSFRPRDESISSSVDSSADTLQDLLDSDVEEDPSKIFDSDLDDIMTVCNSDEEDLNTGMTAEDEEDGNGDYQYYELLPEDELRRLLREEPWKYKHCIIRLDGTHAAKCRVLDIQHPNERRCDSTTTNHEKIADFATNGSYSECLKGNKSDVIIYSREELYNSDDASAITEIEIRGRANCGPSFSGDEVVVELKKTRELGDDAEEVYRGTVIGILKRHTDRRAYTFVCRVDTHAAHLMRPINGVAPKIHVVHSVIKSQYPEKKNELVAKYHMEDGELTFDKIVRLDPKRRKDMLFVVKYIRWRQKCMYPLGYVTKIITSGESLENSQKVLNLLHQVPTKPSEKCSEAAKELLENRVGSENNLLLDMRNYFTLSIDPSDCKDVDDALTLRKTEFGFEVGVHIADVSEFVEKDGVIDRNARKRVTSYYPATKKVYHMLPAELSENLCSLKEGEERLALSVFVTISSDGDVLGQSTNIRRTKIQNNKTMTYEEAQAYIDNMPSSKPTFLDERNEKSIVLHLNYLAKKLRAKRINRGQYYYQEDNPFAVEKCHDAHRLVEEFMILANIQVANFLVSKFPECTPIRRQLSPNSEELEKWYRKNNELINCSFYFNQFECLSQQDGEDVTENVSANLSILMQTLKRLKMAAEKGDLQAVKTIVGSEWLHPYHSLAMIDWWGLQETAEFVPYGDLDGLDPDHFSLQVPFYVQFTSPIRRYMDIVIHRLVKCALEHEPASYSLEDIRRLCDKVNDVCRIAKKYHKASKLLELTVLLKTPFYLPCFVEGFDDDSLTLTIPHLGKVTRSQRVLKYSALSVGDKPEVSDKIELLWEMRLYDAEPAANLRPYARKPHNARKLMRIESNRHVAHVLAPQWRNLMDAISNEDVITSRKLLVEIMEGVSLEKQCRTEQSEVTSEMYNDALIVKHHVLFSQKLTRGSVMAAQLGAECTNGFLQPVIRMVNLTPEKDICVEHRTDPVKCFAELATKKVLQNYNSIDSYRSIWLPILAMEAASKTVAAGNTVLCNNISVFLEKRNGAYTGEFSLPVAFCKKRKFYAFQNPNYGEEESNDFMCIRYQLSNQDVFKSKDILCTSFVRNIWTGHAIAKSMSVSESEDFVVKFRLEQFDSLPPKELLDAGKLGSKCSIEFLTKLLPDRRMEGAVNSLHDSSDLCKRIALGQRVEDLPEITKYPKHDTYDVEVDVSTKIYKNNSSQTEAIRNSLQGKFTLIQGPPGTGKTVTGIKVAYWFVRMNHDLRASGGARGQVLYCGPSNSSVDVAAKWLKKLGKNCPKIVRLYSQALEKQVFPIPRDNLQIGSMGGRHYELIDKDENKDIALHHIIRQKGKQFSAKIKAFDKLFAANRDTPEKVSDEEVEEYQKLVTDASINELKEYDVILCTCAASVSPRMLRGANIHQIITDESGMCMEPETLIPLQAFKSTRQVVLIGDHKQLQPIVFNNIAKGLGLDISLFERYKDRAIMLTEQYRMHPGICEFPSKQFYDGKLTTAEKHDCIDEKWLKIWPKGRYRPMVFCHAEGPEKVLSVSTEDGNERSRSNELEEKEAARIFLSLVNYYKVNPDKITILSQYKAQCTAIERNLKSLGYKHLNVGTVVASQGDEWDYVILSLVRSMPEYEIEKKPSIGWCQKNMGFIIDEHQINVALTRARLGLIIIGNKHLLECDNMWKELLRHYDFHGLVMNTEDFLPSANRLKQRPRNDVHHASGGRFSNQTRGPWNNQSQRYSNTGQHSTGSRSFQNSGQSRSGQSHEQIQRRHHDKDNAPNRFQRPNDNVPERQMAFPR